METGRVARVRHGVARGDARARSEVRAGEDVPHRERKGSWKDWVCASMLFVRLAVWRMASVQLLPALRREGNRLDILTTMR